MNKKNILYVGGFELPDKNAAAQRVIGNAKVLKELGYNIFFLGVNKDKEYNSSLDKSNNFNGFTYYEEKYPKSKKRWIEHLASIKNVEYIIKNKLDNKIDIIIAYNYPAIALLKLKKYGEKNHIKIISDCTEWYSANSGNLIFRIIKWMDTTVRMRLIQPKLDGVIVISEYLENYYKNKCKTCVIPPLVDLNDKKWEKIDVINNNEVNLIYAGSPGTKKRKNAKDRLDILIEYLFKLNMYNFKFHIIGVTKEEYVSIFNEQKEKLNIMKDKVVFYGRLPHEKCIEQVKKSDFVIFTRNDDRVTKAGFPTKFAEAISAGIPVITNESSDLNKYLFNGENVFFIDLKNERDTINLLENILQININEINSMKKNIKKSRCFDYREYKNIVEIFMNRINK